MRKNEVRKVSVKSNFLYSLALMSLTPCEYKCVLTVLEFGECTQAELSNKLGIARQNINKAVTRLESFNVLVRTKTEGRNIFFIVNTDFSIDEFDKNQLTLPL